MGQYVSKAIAAIYLVTGLWLSLNHCIAPVWITAAYVILTGLSFASKTFWLAAITPIVVLGSLYPWTGDMVFAEYDVGLFAILGGRLLGQRLRYQTMGLLWWFVALVWMFAAIRGWLSLPNAEPGDQLSLYTTGYNAIQQAKVILYAMALVPMLVSVFSGQGEVSSPTASDRFGLGVLISALGAGIVVIAERYVTVGLWDWDRIMRAAGPCMTMHIGDQHLDAFWALTLPYVITLRKASWRAMAIQSLLILVVAYSIFATMSRTIIVSSAMIAIAISLAQLTHFNGKGLIPLAIKNRPKLRVRFLHAFGSTIVATCLVSVVLVFWFAGEAIPKRFSAATEGLSARIDHWKSVWRMTNESTTGFWLGTGLGTHPIEFRRFSGRPQQPVSLVTRDGRRGLRLFAGEQIYVAQALNATKTLPWNVELSLMRSSPNCDVDMSLCHQVLLQSEDCVVGVRIPTAAQDENGLERRSFRFTQSPIDVSNPKDEERHKWCPNGFSLFAIGNAGEHIEIFDLDIVDVSGNHILQNADFQAGSRHWFFICDDHIIWRAKNCLLHLLVEMGLIGLVVNLALAASISFKCIYLSINQRCWPAFTVVLSLVGFLAIGLFGTLVDTPWILLMVVTQLAIGQGLALQATTTELAPSVE
jgi:hypothetical protein